jgi:hypothetical protein
MTWFNYLTSGQTNYAPVRRQIVFPQLSENLKSGDWIHVNLDNLDIGRYYYLEDSLIKSSFDTDAYLVVYETENSKVPTFSLILGSISSDLFRRNLWFKSITNVDSGSKPSGEYYIYYHKDNIQYIQLQGNEYVSTANPSGSNYIAVESGNSSSAINFYSTEVSILSNQRLSNFGFLGDSGIWVEGKSTKAGAKAIGTFSGPKIKIYADKNSSSGFISLKIVKSSATGQGQQVVKDNLKIDLYSSTIANNQLIYELDMQQELSFSTYDELYGDFYFEITILDEKNPSSSSIGAKLTSYAFSKNYELQFNSEEIKSDIAFKSTGGVK